MYQKPPLRESARSWGSAPLYSGANRPFNSNPDKRPMFRFDGRFHPEPPPKGHGGSSFRSGGPSQTDLRLLVGSPPEAPYLPQIRALFGNIARFARLTENPHQEKIRTESMF